MHFHSGVNDYHCEINIYVYLDLILVPSSDSGISSTSEEIFTLIFKYLKSI